MAFPSTRLPVTVEIAPGADPAGDPGTWTWTDITSSVRLKDRIEIAVGRADESARVAPSTCRLRLDNRTGDFTPRNPLGQWYGTLGRNTPLRVRVDPGSGAVTRFSGFVSSWPPRWKDKSGRNASVPIEANGVLRRLGQGSPPAKSAIRRAYVNAGVLAYWPLEDKSDSTQLASAITGHPAAAMTGRASPGSDSTLAGSGSLLTAIEPTGAGTAVDIAVAVPPVAITTQWQTECFFNISEQPAGSRTLGHVICADFGYQILLESPSTGRIQVNIFATGGTLITSMDRDTTGLYGDWVHFALHARQFGSTIDWAFEWAPVSQAGVSTNSAAGTPFTGTLAQPVQIELGSIDSTVSVGLGHIGVFDAFSSETHWVADNGHWGEEAHTRIARLCTEDGIQFTSSATTSQAMGAQPQADFVSLLEDCADADMGVLCEENFGLCYVSRTERYNRSVDLALNVDSGHVAEPPEPIDDDQALRNRWVVSRADGSSAVAEDTDSIDNDGLYEDSVTVNVSTDDALADHASWRVHLGA